MNENLTHFSERDTSQWVYDGDFSIDYNWEHKNGLWTETNWETYMDQFECLPPKRVKESAFMVGEPYDHVEIDGKWHVIYAVFIEVDNRYFGKYGWNKSFNLVNYRKEIRKQFEMEIA